MRCPRSLGDQRVFRRLSVVNLDDLPERWEPLERQLAPALVAELVELLPSPRR